MTNQNIDNMTIDEIKKNIESYSQNLKQIQSALEIEENNTDLESTAKKKALKNLQKDVINAVNFFKSALDFKMEQISFNKDDIQKKSIGKCAAIYYENDSKWYNGIINSINDKCKLCNITYFGYKETADVPFKYIRPIKEVSMNEMIPGISCEVIFKEDGLWYPATVERTSELGIHVKFTQYKNEEIVQSDYIRITPEQQVQNWKKKKENEKNGNNIESLGMNEKFVIPQNLKISPADSEEQRLLKRKRVKQLKKKNKQKQIEKITQEKQQDWINFRKKLNSSNNSNNKTLNGFTPMIKLRK